VNLKIRFKKTERHSKTTQNQTEKTPEKYFRVTVKLRKQGGIKKQSQNQTPKKSGVFRDK